MTTISQEAPVGRRRHAELWVREMWASVAITAMWVAVAFSAIFGPDFVSTSADGNSTTIPSGIGVAMFASIGTWFVAKYGFRRRPGDD